VRDSATTLHRFTPIIEKEKLKYKDILPTKSARLLPLPSYARVVEEPAEEAQTRPKQEPEKAVKNEYEFTQQYLKVTQEILRQPKEGYLSGMAKKTFGPRQQRSKDKNNNTAQIAYKNLEKMLNILE